MLKNLESFHPLIFTTLLLVLSNSRFFSFLFFPTINPCGTSPAFDTLYFHLIQSSTALQRKAPVSRTPEEFRIIYGQQNKNCHHHKNIYLLSNEEKPKNGTRIKETDGPSQEAIFSSTKERYRLQFLSAIFTKVRLLLPLFVHELFNHSSNIRSSL